MTKDKDKTSNATFNNWDPDVDWQTSPWNYKGFFGIKKRELEAMLVARAVEPEQALPKRVEAGATVAADKAGVVMTSQDEPRGRLVT